jgi:hypothetical protein
VFADLNRELPGEPTVSVVVRLDRLRDTIWAERTEAIVSPMPDYRAVVADDAGSFFDHFDTLIMSSPRPRDVTATLVAARIRHSPEQARAFLDRAARIAWRPGPRGLVGDRAAGPSVHPRDDRRFALTPPAWLVLSPPGYLDALGALAPGTDGDWLTRLDALEAATCARTPCAEADDGPVAIATIARIPPTLRVPLIGSLPIPGAATITLSHAGQGFYLRGSLGFDDADAARAFVAAAERKRAALIEGFTRQLLSGVRALNAAEGLRLRAIGPVVTFATSFSALDARSLLDLAARYVALYFDELAAARGSLR